MTSIIAESIFKEIKPERSMEIENITYDSGNTGELKIKLKNFLGEEKYLITFISLGFRVLDEGDLLEFWSSINMQKGWAYRVIQGGWKEQESMRSGFLLKESYFEEYLICGQDDCVSVFSDSPPTLMKLEE